MIGAAGGEMKTVHLESAFETEIVAHLVQHGCHQGDRTAYRRDLGLDLTELLGFLQATQPQSWNELVALPGQR
jgi:type I restriction enzyme R subunit